MKLAATLGFVLANSRLQWFTTAVIFKHSFSAIKPLLRPEKNDYAKIFMAKCQPMVTAV